MNKLPRDIPVPSAVLIACVKQVPFFINLSMCGVKDVLAFPKILSARRESIVKRKTLGYIISKI